MKNINDDTALKKIKVDCNEYDLAMTKQLIALYFDFYDELPAAMVVRLDEWAKEYENEA